MSVSFDRDCKGHNVTKLLSSVGNDVKLSMSTSLSRHWAPGVCTAPLSSSMNRRANTVSPCQAFRSSRSRIDAKICVPLPHVYLIDCTLRAPPNGMSICIDLVRLLYFYYSTWLNVMIRKPFLRRCTHTYTPSTSPKNGFAPSFKTTTVGVYQVYGSPITYERVCLVADTLKMGRQWPQNTLSDGFKVHSRHRMQSAGLCLTACTCMPFAINKSCIPVPHDKGLGRENCSPLACTCKTSTLPAQHWFYVPKWTLRARDYMHDANTKRSRKL